MNFILLLVGSELFHCFVATLFSHQVDSGNRHGVLLEVVQLLTDLDLTVSKAYISSDGRWFMVGKSGKPAILFSGYWVEQKY